MPAIPWWCFLQFSRRVSYAYALKFSCSYNKMLANVQGVRFYRFVNASPCEGKFGPRCRIYCPRSIVGRKPLLISLPDKTDV
jgi:hypothetical protein